MGGKLRKGRSEVELARDVSRQGHTADFVGDYCCRGFVQVKDANFRASRRQSSGNRCSDPLSGTRHQGDFAGE
jgi:hypothetical protein